MKRSLTPLFLFTLAAATLNLPALADFNVDFGNHDRNHDHRWNYEEFHHANQNYYSHHPRVTVVSDRDLHHHFERLDRDHDGYINVSEARSYRNWD
jgi:hypothetical protein